MMQEISKKDNEVLVKVENVSKKFCRSLKRSLWYGLQDAATELTGRKSDHALRKDEFWAVDDVSFELRRGECLGLIGPNGAGKSTLLKMLNGLIKPDRGRIEMRGRVGALIELGAGFNPILTGRENIYVNAAVLGLSKKDTDTKLDSIVDFAEIGDFLDTSVQNYSSGMKMRLGFAIAAQLSPDVLIIDEILAVGDIGFRSKCYNAVSGLSKNTAIIMVSHSMPQVSRLSSKILLLSKGKEEFIGSTGDGIGRYYNLFRASSVNKNRAGSGEALIKKIDTLNRNFLPSDRFNYGENFIVRMEIFSGISIPNLVIDLGFYTLGDEAVAECNNYVMPKTISIKRQKTLQVDIKIDKLSLNPGIYKLSAFLLSENMTHHFDWLQNFMSIEVVGERSGIAGNQFHADWSVSNVDAAKN